MFRGKAQFPQTPRSGRVRVPWSPHRKGQPPIQPEIPIVNKTPPLASLEDFLGLGVSGGIAQLEMKELNEPHPSLHLAVNYTNWSTVLPFGEKKEKNKITKA